MSPTKSPADHRPFQSKADRQRQQPLEEKHRDIAIPDLAALLKQPKPAAAKSN